MLMAPSTSPSVIYDQVSDSDWTIAEFELQRPYLQVFQRLVRINAGHLNQLDHIFLSDIRHFEGMPLKAIALALVRLETPELHADSKARFCPCTRASGA